MRTTWFLSLLVAITLFIYAQTLGFSFLNYDDDAYVTANPYVVNGLALNSAYWAFTSFSRFYWHPLTWLSLMTDVALFGVNPGAMHAVNLFLHVATAILLFDTLRKLTKNPTKSMIVAALFAIHPLRVESVAWIAERKDVLCGLLIVLTLWCYERYARQPSRRNYGYILLAFGMACMAKPMAVVIPVLMLAIDYWPLKRTALREKLPFFAIAAALALLAYSGQKAAGALDMAGPLSWATRIQNAIYSLGRYVTDTFIPMDLAILYPYRDPVPLVFPMATLLVAISGVAAWQHKQRPWLLSGWIWFVAGLLPTLGLVQAGVQARADRFTYIPQIGLLLMIVWTLDEFLSKRFVPAVLATAIVLLTVASWRQTATWLNSETVFAHAVSHTSDNWLAELKYGTALAGRGDNKSATPHLLRAAHLNPSDPHSRYLLGRAAAAETRYVEAATYFAEAIQRKPDYGDAYFSRASMLVASGQEVQALPVFEKAIQLELAPEWKASAHTAIGAILARAGRLREAEEHFRAALAISPNSTDARRNLAIAQEQMRRTMGETF
jgi:tetratricopeptide (TPR) repeat protein